MIIVLAALLLQSPQTTEVPDSVLVEETRLRPDSARNTLRRLLSSLSRQRTILS